AAWRAEAARAAPRAAAAAAELAGKGHDERLSREARAELVAAIAPAAAAIARAAAEDARAGDRAAFGAASGERLAARESALEALASLHAEAALAGLQLVPAASRPDGSDALVAAAAAAAASASASGAGDPLARLAAARLARDVAARLLARAPLSPGRAPWTDAPLSRPPRRALAHALRLAERAARQHASAARVAIGHIPAGARLAYQAARALARGRPGERLRAVELYRAASAESQLAVLLALSAASPVDPASPATPPPAPS